jgi:hypothetical protein
MASRSAACACGKLHVTCEGEPARVLICHCTACQKRTGSPYGVGAYYPEDQVAIAGTSRLFERTSDAGRWFKNYFCPDCGSTVYWQLELRPGMIAVAVGMFADPEFPAPIASVWGRHRWSWVPTPGGVVVHEAGLQA